jgi:hypothetical protein
MAQDTPVNSQITDAVTQTNVKVLGDAPAMAMGTLYQTIAQTAGIAANNATLAQQQTNVLAQAILTRCVQTLIGSDQSTSK